jgi:hypothetical protein
VVNVQGNEPASDDLQRSLARPAGRILRRDGDEFRGELGHLLPAVLDDSPECIEHTVTGCQ